MGRSRRWLLLLVTVAALVLVWPVLAEVYGSLDEAFAVGPWWLGAILVVAALQFVSSWQLHRIVLRTRRWFGVAAPQLAGNAVSHVAPAGTALGAGLQLRMLNASGFPIAQAVTSLGATTVLASVTEYVVLPMVVLIAAAAGSDVSSELVAGMWVGAAVLAVLLGGVVWASTRDAPWRALARVMTRAGRVVGRDADSHEITTRLLAERNLIRQVMRDRTLSVAAFAVGRAAGDYVALYLALLAVGARVNPAAALAAFLVSNLAGLIPLTPGGVGFVEAGLTGVITLAGASTEHALAAVAIYRLAATWLPCAAGLVAYLMFRRRQRRSTVQPARSAASAVASGGPVGSLP